MTMAGLATMRESARAVVVNAQPRVSPIVPTGRHGNNTQKIRWPRAGGAVRVSSAHCPPLIGLCTLDAIYLKSAIGADSLTVRRGKCGDHVEIMWRLSARVR